jgi:hypothetical protein
MYDVEIELASHNEEYGEITAYHIPNNPTEDMWVRLEDKDGALYFTPISLIESITIRYSEESKKPFGL